ncbi:unnamed protein product [marine sediment metagenome]|uniref:Uncharacterized protein n=1 Tax=marine sediment metagenome TaxID=412755 RepID=X0SI20_9ZZZZ
MSWKLFLQIVLLLIVGALVLASLKISLLNYKYGCKAKYMQTQKPHGRLQGSPQKGYRK